MKDSFMSPSLILVLLFKPILLWVSGCRCQWGSNSHNVAVVQICRLPFESAFFWGCSGDTTMCVCVYELKAGRLTVEAEKCLFCSICLLTSFSAQAFNWKVLASNPKVGRKTGKMSVLTEYYSVGRSTGENKLKQSFVNCSLNIFL